jgi:hypothetical protein
MENRHEGKSGVHATRLALRRAIQRNRHREIEAHLAALAGLNAAGEKALAELAPPDGDSTPAPKADGGDPDPVSSWLARQAGPVKAPALLGTVSRGSN